MGGWNLGPSSHRGLQSNLMPTLLPQPPSHSGPLSAPTLGPHTPQGVLRSPDGRGLEVPSHRPIDWIEQKELEKNAGSHVFFPYPLPISRSSTFHHFFMDLHFICYSISHFSPQCADPSATQYRPIDWIAGYCRKERRQSPYFHILKFIDLQHFLIFYGFTFYLFFLSLISPLNAPTPRLHSIGLPSHVSSYQSAVRKHPQPFQHFLK